MVTGASGTVRDAVEQYKSGGLSQTPSPTVPEYSGLGGVGAGAGAGAGMGGGRGMGGRGGGRPGLGLVQSCRCPNCGYTQPHQPGVPCVNQACPKCGAVMVGV